MRIGRHLLLLLVTCRHGSAVSEDVNQSTSGLTPTADLIKQASSPAQKAPTTIITNTAITNPQTPASTVSTGTSTKSVTQNNKVPTVDQAPSNSAGLTEENASPQTQSSSTNSGTSKAIVQETVPKIAATTTLNAKKGTPTIINVVTMTSYVGNGAARKPVTITKTVVQVGEVTGTSLAQVNAAIDAASQKNEDTGLGARNRKIIIGVVAGLGGFIIMAAVGFILVRMWCKQQTGDRFGFKDGYTGADISDSASDHDVQRFNSGISANF